MHSFAGIFAGRSASILPVSRPASIASVSWWASMDIVLSSALKLLASFIKSTAHGVPAQQLE